MASKLVLGCTVIGADRVGAALVKFADSLADLSPFWVQSFAPRFFGQVQSNFAQEGYGRGRDDSGRYTASGQWAQLSWRYWLWKDKHYPGQPILTRTGRLRNSLTWSGGSPGPEGMFWFGPNYAVAGTAVPYGVHHQTGTDKMPARPFVDNQQSGEWSTLLRAWVAREGQRHGLTVGLLVEGGTPSWRSPL